MTSHSSTQRFNTCPFSYKLHKEGLRKVFVGPEANYMAWGKAGHGALEAHYKGEDFNEVLGEFSRLYPNDLDPTNAVWSREGGYKTIEAYINYYQEIDKQWEVLATELKDDPINPTLIIDLVAKQKQTGSIYFWDHKFKAKAPWGADRRYGIDAQISRYTDYVQQNYGDCAGAVINIVVPGYRQRAYKGEPAGWHWKFERPIVGRTPQQMEFWRESQAEWEGLIDSCNLSGHYPKHLGYNCTSCQFYEYCFSGADEEVRDALYTTEDIETFEVVVEGDSE